MKKLEEWFDKYLGWFFINGRKKEAWERYLKIKYHDRKRSN